MKKILVVDDEPELVVLLKDVLKSAGYDVLSAANGEEALAAYREAAPDAITTDFDMPKLDGIGLVKKLREDMGYTGPLFMISGDVFKSGEELYVSDKAREKLSKHGLDVDTLRQYVTRFLGKPFKLSDLEEGLRASFGEH